jgi:hypothetical protein
VDDEPQVTTGVLLAYTGRMADSREYNMLILVAIAFRWSLRPLDDSRWELRSPGGKAFITGTDASGMPEIDEDLKTAIKESAGDKTGNYPTKSIAKSVGVVTAPRRH